MSGERYSCTRLICLLHKLLRLIRDRGIYIQYILCGLITEYGKEESFLSHTESFTNG